MRILVISDSHGRINNIEKAIEAHPSVQHIFFLGDCVNDLENLRFIYDEKIFHTVSGNCDHSSFERCSDMIELGGLRIFYTHGHLYSVKSGMERLREAATSCGADLVLYGHTHIAKTEYDGGVYYVNPGSIGMGRSNGESYAVIDIEHNGIMPVIIKL